LNQRTTENESLARSAARQCQVKAQILLQKSAKAISDAMLLLVRQRIAALRPDTNIIRMYLSGASPLASFSLGP
jgi:hypothetical protein